jgi:hypothetical protein
MSCRHHISGLCLLERFNDCTKFAASFPTRPIDFFRLKESELNSNHFYTALKISDFCRSEDHFGKIIKSEVAQRAMLKNLSIVLLHDFDRQSN